MTKVAIGIFLSLCILNTAQGVRVSFEMIPDALSASDMSPDGRFISGFSDFDGDLFPDGIYLLDRQLGVRTELPAPGLSAAGVSDDGTVVVGNMIDPVGGLSVAGRWTAETGWVSLGSLPTGGTCPDRSTAYEVSGDGSAVVGLSWHNGCDSRGFLWTEQGGMQELEGLANGVNRASVVSTDGSRIGGFAQGTFNRTPAAWSSDTMGQLLDPPNGDAIGEIHGMRDDGSVLLGEWLEDNVPGSPQATRWTATPTGWVREQIGTGSLLPGWIGTPLDIADDDTVVGFDILLTNRRAWIQPQGEGPLIDLRQYFESNGAQLPAGLTLEFANRISADGRTIVGFGNGGWIATIFSDCDLDSDLNCDSDDIDALIAAIVNNDADSIYDLTGDGILDLADRDTWLATAGAENLPSGNAYLLGDINLDGTVDAADFIIWNENRFTATGTWSQGDMNADGSTDGSDFVLWNVNKFSSADVANIPEPSLPTWLLVLPLFGPRQSREQRCGDLEISELPRQGPAFP